MKHQELGRLEKDGGKGRIAVRLRSVNFDWLWDRRKEDRVSFAYLINEALDFYRLHKDTPKTQTIPSTPVIQ